MAEPNPQSSLDNYKTQINEMMNKIQNLRTEIQEQLAIKRKSDEFRSWTTFVNETASDINNLENHNKKLDEDKKFYDELNRSNENIPEPSLNDMKKGLNELSNQEIIILKKKKQIFQSIDADANEKLRAMEVELANAPQIDYKNADQICKTQHPNEDGDLTKNLGNLSKLTDNPS